MESSQSVRSNREDILIRQLSCLDLKIKQIKKIANLTPNVRVKVEALKRTQQELLEREAEFHRKIHTLEVEQQKIYDEVNDKRRQIVTGSGMPPLEGLPTFSDDAADQSSGIPEFWLTVFKMTPVLQTMIREADEEALKRLVDVRVVLKNDPQPGFELLFEFEPNDFFNDRILRKEYLMKCVPDVEKPFAFNGFDIYDTNGQDIDWKDGANLTKLTVKDENGSPHEVMTNSFFNFFNPKALFEEKSLLSMEFLETDFEIGYYIKERVIPRATLFFVGEIDDELDDLSDSLEDDSVCEMYDLRAEGAEKHANSEDDTKEEKAERQ